MATIFINYRRDDSTWPAAWLYETLTERFGTEQVFMDVAAVPAGAQWEETIFEEIEKCSVFIVLIGPKWLDARTEKNERRLDQKDDVVRREIAAALANGKYVIPVLLEETHIPQKSNLPGDIVELLKSHCHHISSVHFRQDVEKLLGSIEKELPAYAVPALDLNSDSDFAFRVLAPRDEQEVQNDDLPLKTEGSYTAKANELQEIRKTVFIWAILEDEHGAYYLQNPPISLLPHNQWVATNILPGLGIRFIHFIRVTPDGNNAFKARVKARDWGAFYELPPNNTFLETIRINRADK